MMKFAMGLAVLMAMNTAHAAFDVCAVVDRPLSGAAAEAAVAMGQREVAVYKEKLARECALAKTYQKLKSDAQAWYGVRLEEISAYQGMRYIQRSFYERAKAENSRLQTIYQMWRSDYSKPEDEQSTILWDNWLVGIRQLEGAQRFVKNGVKFTMQDLTHVHQGFYQLTNQDGDFAHSPVPGALKSPNDNDGHWWKFKTENEGLEAKKTVEGLNKAYAALGLRPVVVEPRESVVNDILSVRRLDNEWAIYSGDTRGNTVRVTTILDFMNKMLSQGRRGEHMSWNNRLMTPGEVAFLVQQYFVGVHPFHEGNGRMSRFLQEIVLTVFGLPHGSSGDLMDIDVLTDNATYYRTAIAKTEEQLGTVRFCLDSVLADIHLVPGKTVFDADQGKLRFDCRLLERTKASR